MASSSKRNGDKNENPTRKMIRVSSASADETIKPAATLEFSGIIQRIILKNIFCHEHLDFDGFTPSVNLLQGANGSGKSSIVASIIAGLGGATKATDRGKNITSLIQNGKTSASIEIHLKNKGHLACKHEVYGDKVIIERKLNISGASSYKIKSADGHVVSTKKEDLNRILDWYNFQVDNPVLILSQERAKTFLSSTDPKVLFEFFMRATQLRQWCDTYDMIVRDNQACKNIIKHKINSLPKLEKEVKEWEKKVQAINSLAKKRETLSELRRAKEWAEVKEGEDHVTELNVKLSRLEMSLRKLEDVVAKVEEKRKELADKGSASDGELVSLAEQSKHWESERTKWNTKFLEAKRTLRERTNGKRELEKEAFQKDRDVHALKDKLTKDNNEAVATWATTVAELSAEKEKLTKCITKLEIGVKTEQVHMENFLQSLQEAQEDFDHYFLQEIGIQKRLASLKSEFQNVREQKNNLSVFGQFMPVVVAQIQALSQRFKEEPIGPIGAYIKVRDQKWAHIVENVTKGILSTFLVSGKADYELLNQIFNKVIPRGQLRPKVIVTTFRRQVHQMSQYEVRSPPYFSMWSIIETENVQVANTLLDQLQVESLLLVPTPDEANDLLIEARLVPKNCKRAMTLRGDTYYPDPNFKVYSGRGQTKVQFLQVSVEDKIEDLQKNINSTRKEVTNSRLETIEKRKRLESLQAEKRKSTDKMNAQNKKVNELRAQLQELKNREVPPPPDVYQLQNDLKESEAIKAQVEQKALVLEEEIKEAREQVKLAEEALKSAQKESENIKRTANEHEVSTAQIQKKLLQKKKELLAYGNKTKEILTLKEELLLEVEEKKKQVEEKVAEIVAVYPERVFSRKSKKELERELHALQSALEREESSHGQLEVVTSTWRIKKGKYERIKGEVKAQQFFVAKMTDCLKDRTHLLKVTRKLLAMHLQLNFKAAINHRKLVGFVDIDFNAETLKILMTKDTGSKNDKLHSLQMMSSGERSFATVSFIVALWDIVNSPLRIMDEFDIFMDVVSKNQCVEMILDSVRDSIQYIIISPLECKIRSHKLHVFRMPNPDRRMIEESEEVKQIRLKIVKKGDMFQTFFSSSFF